MRIRPRMVRFDWTYHNLEKIRRPKAREKPRNITPVDLARLFSRWDTWFLPEVEFIPSPRPGIPAEVRYSVVGYEVYEVEMAERAWLPRYARNRILYVVFTVISYGDTRYARIISARQANQQERKEFLRVRQAAKAQADLGRDQRPPLGTVR
jgi:uncharacterized DUF497 family protein